jgi:hypothetical protein
VLLRLFAEASTFAKFVAVILLPGLAVGIKFFKQTGDVEFYSIIVIVQALYCALLIGLGKKLGKARNTTRSN